MRNVKRYSTLLIITEIQFKTTMIRCLTSVRMALIKGKRGKCWEGCGEKGTCMCSWWECKLVKLPLKRVWLFLNNWYDLAIPFLHIYSRKWNHCLENLSEAPVYCSFIYSIQDRETICLSMDEWIKKMWHVYAMGYYFAIKNQDFLSYVTKWMRLEGIMLSEIRQTEKYSMISLMWATRKLSRFIFIFKKMFWLHLWHM